MDTLTVKPETQEQMIALKAFLKAWKIDFTSDGKLYNLEFEEKILQGREDIKNGKGVTIAIAGLWK